MKKRFLKAVIIVLAVAAVLGGAAFGAVLWRVHQSVRRYCDVAQQAHPHPGDDVAALVDFMMSDGHSLRDRNLAVWALGHLRDPQALPSFASPYTGELCVHEEFLCQYELEKAIKLCGGTPEPPRKTRH